ncbi:MAG: hypothetical protein JEZ02_10425 [Desulfatibacillum sp.]|nr:hypothetical protein [Desulfatibacillum sp.]
MKIEYSFCVCSDLFADRDTLWQHSTDLALVNREFFPLLKMTYPENASELTPNTVTLGKRVFRSWILLFGIFPVEYDDIVLAEVNPGHGFCEKSSMLAQNLWQHQRTITDTPTGSRVTDEITFIPRIPYTGYLQKPLFTLLFKYRHWRLKKIFS